MNFLVQMRFSQKRPKLRAQAKTKKIEIHYFSMELFPFFGNNSLYQFVKHC